MIVRINQFDMLRAETEAGWAAGGLLGPIEFVWPEGTHAYEILILDQDEQRRPLPESFRQAQLRQLIPEALAALREPAEEIVLRLDGPLAEGELLAAFNHLTDPGGAGRFAVSQLLKLEPQALDVIGSVRVQPPPQGIGAICVDPRLGLERSVRLRAFAVPEELINPVLEAGATDDERWSEILRQAGFVLSTVRGLRSLQVISRRFESGEVRSRLMQRLMAQHQSKA